MKSVRKKKWRRFAAPCLLIIQQKNLNCKIHGQEGGRGGERKRAGEEGGRGGMKRHFFIGVKGHMEDIDVHY